MNIKEVEELNKLYKPLDDYYKSVKRLLNDEGYELKSGWYNNHFVSAEGEMCTEYFPIPVITVIGLCDVGLDFDHVFVEAYLCVERLLAVDFSKLKKEFTFEIYGEVDYLSNVCTSDDEVAEIVYTLKSCDEKNVCINFILAKPVSWEKMLDLISTIRMWNL